MKLEVMSNPIDQTDESSFKPMVIFGSAASLFRSFLIWIFGLPAYMLLTIGVAGALLITLFPLSQNLQPDSSVSVSAPPPSLLLSPPTFSGTIMMWIGLLMMLAAFSIFIRAIRRFFEAKVSLFEQHRLIFLNALSIISWGVIWFNPVVRQYVPTSVLNELYLLVLFVIFISLGLERIFERRREHVEETVFGSEIDEQEK